MVGEGRNLREVEGDPTAHAEVVALRAAARALGEWRLEDCTLVVTLEPCPMCAGALMLSRISRLVLGAWDPKLGATGSVWDIVRDRRATHRVEVVGGVRASECSQLLLSFFEGHRNDASRHRRQPHRRRPRPTGGARVSGIINSLVNQVLGSPPWLVYLIVALVVFAEDALFVGFVLPGETLAIIGGVTASLGHTSLAWVLVVVILAAIIGDSVGYEIGRLFGPRVMGLKILERRQEQLDSAQDFLRRRGGSAVFLGRWTAFFRAVMPALAGLSGMRYRVFLPWNAIGGIAWGATAVTAGYLAGESYHRVEKWLGRGAAGIVGADRGGGDRGVGGPPPPRAAFRPVEVIRDPIPVADHLECREIQQRLRLSSPDGHPAVRRQFTWRVENTPCPL